MIRSEPTAIKMWDSRNSRVVLLKLAELVLDLVKGMAPLGGAAVGRGGRGVGRRARGTGDMLCYGSIFQRILRLVGHRGQKSWKRHGSNR